MSDDFWKCPITPEGWEALNQRTAWIAKALGISLGDEEMSDSTFDRNSDSSKLERLASACSDHVLGGECGWERMDFEEFVSLVRKQCAEANRLRSKPDSTGQLKPREIGRAHV